MRALGSIHLTLLALLLVLQPLNGAGPPADYSFSASCPGTAWNDTLISSSWGGVLPGDVANDDFPRDGLSSTPVPGYPESPPPACFHGGGHYVAWLSTNGFARTFMIAYDVLSVIGEAKHGFWQWSQPGQDDNVEFWWCQLGGNANSTEYMSGHADSSSAGGHTDTNSARTMNGMQALWQYIRQKPNLNQYGPLAIKAKLPDFATTAVKMHHAQGLHTWGNNGDSTRPYYFPVDTLDSAEFYIFEAPYVWPDMFHVSEPCHLDRDTTTAGCGLLNTFVGMVVEKPATERYTGMTTSGLHYGPDADACPASCGAGPCRCNAVLFDLVMHGFLDTKYTAALQFMPTWVNKWLGPTGALPIVGDDGGDDDDGLSTGLVVLIALSNLLAGALLGAAAIWFYMRRAHSDDEGVDGKASAKEQQSDAKIVLNDLQIDPSKGEDNHSKGQDNPRRSTSTRLI